MAEKLGDEQRLARVYTYLINYYYMKGEPELAIEYGERCLRIGDGQSTTVRSRRWRAAISGIAAMPRASTGGPKPSSRRTSRRSRAPGRRREAAQAEHLVRDVERLARLHARRDRRVRGGAGLPRRAHQAAETSGHAYTQTIARTLAGLVWMRRGQLDRALALLQKSLDACREKNLDVWRPIPSSLLGLTCVLLGRADEGLRLLGDGMLLTEELGVRPTSPSGRRTWARAWLVAGQVERARTHGPARPRSGRRPQGARASGLGAPPARRHRRATAVPGETGAADKAAAYYAQSLSLAEELGMRPSSRGTTWDSDAVPPVGRSRARRGAPRDIEHDAEPSSTCASGSSARPRS